MGDIKRKQKKYSRPKKLFERVRIDAENILVRSFGLKNKREIWKAESEVSKLRRRAKSLIPKSEDEKKKFFEKLNKMGFKVIEIADVLGLKTEDWLERRLQTFIVKKGLVNSPRQARQFIVHRYVLVDGKVVNVPSFFVTKDLENKISLKVRKEKKKREVVEVAAEENVEGGEN